MEPLEHSKKLSFIKKHAGWFGALFLVLFIALIYWIAPKGTAVERANTEFTMVNLATPPPPPPPPLPPPPVIAKVTEEKMIEQSPVNSNLNSPEDDAMRADTDGPGDAFGLVGSINGKGLGGGGGRWGWYASQVQSVLLNALRKNSKTRTAGMRVVANIWAEPNGRIARVQLMQSTGDQDLDRVLENEVLTDLQLRPPPPDMPMPMHVRLIAKKRS